MQEVLTADVVHFSTQQRFDRVVSIEMFEHMKNYQVSKDSALLRAEAFFGPLLPTGGIATRTWMIEPDHQQYIGLHAGTLTQHCVVDEA